MHAGLGHRGRASIHRVEDAHADRADLRQPLKLPVDDEDVPPVARWLGLGRARRDQAAGDAARHVLVAGEDPGLTRLRAAEDPPAIELLPVLAPPRSQTSNYPPIWLMLRFGRMNVTWPIAWPAHLVPTARTISAARSSSLPPPRTMARRSNSSGLEEAGAQLTLGGEPHAVAVAAERLGHARDDADVAQRPSA